VDGILFKFANVNAQTDAELPQVAFAPGGFRGRFRAAQSRKQKRCEDDDNRDHHQELDKRESSFPS